jgi:DNA-binding transcriptional LysR family regulator
MLPTPHAVRMTETAAAVIDAIERNFLSPPEFDPVTSRAEFAFALTDLSQMVFMPKIMHQLQISAPHITVRCESLSEGQVAQALGNGQCDLALGYFPELGSDLFFHQRLWRHTFVCIVSRKHALDQGVMTTALYSQLGHVVVTSPSRAGGLLEASLRHQGIERRIAMRTPHHLSLPAIVESTDLVATVPLVLATFFARRGGVKILPLPFPPVSFTLEQHWHRRYQQDARHSWIRTQVATLFNDASDGYKSLEQQLYRDSKR